MANRVEPIRDREKIRSIKEGMLRQGAIRDYCLFVCGINFGLRIGDLLRVRIGNLLTPDGSIRESFDIVEQKTSRRNIIVINYEAEMAIAKLISKTDIAENRKNFLIYNTRIPYRKISRIQAYNLVRKWCEWAGITGIPVGTHTLRKTWGYHAHKAGVSIEVIQAKYMHSATKTTRLYLGIERQDVNEAYRKVNL